MGALHEAVLPSGRCVRMRPYDTEAKIALDTRLEQKCAPNQPTSAQTTREVLLTILVAYTEPLPLVYLPALDADKQPVLDDAGKPVLTNRVDVDATLDAVPPSAWIATSYKDMVTKGDKQIEKIFSAIRDWQALQHAASVASGLLDGPEGLGGKVRALVTG